MIEGLGNDIIEVTRIRKSIQNQGKRFLERLFTEKERAYAERFADPVISLSGKFAAKEAVAKALGCGLGKELSWLDIEILNEDSGRPFVEFSQKAKAHWNNPKVWIAISHTSEYANAVALWVQESPKTDRK